MNKFYTAAKSGFILGTWYEKGEPVPVSAAQAKYLVPPLGDAIEAPSAPKARAKEAAAPTKGGNAKN